MNGNSSVDITLSIEQWREVYRILNRDRLVPDETHPKRNSTWHSHLQAIEESCKANQLTVTFPLAMTWPMSATVRLVSEELADLIATQMVAQTHWWDSAENTEESFPMDIEPIGSELVKLSDSPSPSLPDKQLSLYVTSRE